MDIQSTYLVVAAVISGKNFPAKENANLICEARFNEELLCTDSVAQTPHPEFEQELAWELDRASLRQHRLQRSVIKLVVKSVEKYSKSEEILGFIVLDLRACSAKKSFRWHKLLHSKFKNTPELFCGIYIDGDSDGKGSNDFLRAEIVPEKHTTDENDEWLSANANLNQAPLYLIGHKNLADSEFSLSLSWDELVNANSIIPANQEMEHFDGKQYYITCALLGSNLSIGPLNGSSHRIFLNEVHRFHIRSNLDMLKAYFAHSSPFMITLSQDEQPLACGAIPINELIGVGKDAGETSYTIESTVELVPVQPTTSLGDLVHENPHIHLRLTLEQLPQDSTDLQTRPLIRITDFPCDTVQRRSRSTSRSPVGRKCSKSPEKLSSSNPPTLTRSRRSTPSPLPNDSTMRHFCYTIELRAMRLTNSLSPEPMIYARYLYPLFGSGAPVMTFPPVPVVRNREISLPNGFCAFEFASTAAELHDKLLTCPLVVEIYDRSTGSQTCDRLVAQATIQLATVFSSPTHSGALHQMQTQKISDIVDLVEPHIPISSSCGDNKVVGELSYSLVLEDHGIYAGAAQRTSFKSAPLKSLGQTEPLNEDIRSTAEYRTALELELWRAEQESKFQGEMKEREQQLMATFAEEWRKRDLEREKIYRKKLSEYQSLEDQLRSALSDLVLREKQLSAGEIELARIRRDTMRDLDAKRKELTQLSQTRVRELEMQLNLEARQTEELRRQVDQWQSKCRSLEKENSTQRVRLEQLEQNANKTSSGEMPVNAPTQSSSHPFELAQLTTELANTRCKLSETERLLQEVQHGQARYRQLWTRALREIARLKQEAQTNAEQALAKREAELDQLRTRYLRMEELDLAAKFHDQRDLRMERKPTGNATEGARSHGDLDNKRADATRPPQSVEQELNRLIQERDDLLKSGLYDTEDHVIVQLEERIESLVVTK